MASLIASGGIGLTPDLLASTTLAQSSAPTEIVISLDNQTKELPALIKKASHEAGVDPDLALGIAFCESSLKHFNNDGSVRLGKVNPSDIGVFQINRHFHLAKSQALGYDISTAEGNVGYAIWLLKNYGTRAWDWSRPCWDKN